MVRAIWIVFQARKPLFTDVVFGFLLTWLFLPTLLQLFQSWLMPDHSHGWLVLAGVSFFTYKLSSTPRQAGNCSLGSIWMIAGLMLHWAGIVLNWPLLDGLGCIGCVRGWLWAHHGITRVRAGTPLFSLMLFLFPWPEGWLAETGLWLQRNVAIVSDCLLNFTGVCHRTGTRLLISGLENPLNVAAECSGLRQLQIFLAVSVFLAFLWLRSPWKRMLLVVTSVPIAILANTLRVVMLAMLSQKFGENSFSGIWHDAPAMVAIPLGSLLLWLLSLKLKDRTTANADDEVIPSAKQDSLTSHHFILMVIACLLQGWLFLHLFSATTPEISDWSNTLKPLPVELGTWKGVPHPEEDAVRKRAMFADLVLVKGYLNQIKGASVYLAYSQQGNDRLHHPEVCVRDIAGAEELSGSRALVELAVTGHQAMRYVFKQKQGLNIIYYWHYTAFLPKETRMSFLQRLFISQKIKLPSVTMMVSIQATRIEPDQELELKLLRDLDAWMTSILPAGTRCGQDRLRIRLMAE